MQNRQARLWLLAAILLLITGQTLAKFAGLLNGSDSRRLLIYLLAYSCYLLRGGAWLLVLRSLPVSLAYPVMAAAYPVLLLLSRLFFGEIITPARLIASLLIAAGVTLIGTGVNHE